MLSSFALCGVSLHRAFVSTTIFVCGDFPRREMIVCKNRVNPSNHYMKNTINKKERAWEGLEGLFAVAVGIRSSRGKYERTRDNIK